MPASNTSPDTATEVTVFPYTETISAADVSGAPQGTDYPSSCDSHQYHALWWRVTTGAQQVILSMYGKSSTGSDDPIFSVWTGTSPALVQYKNLDSEDDSDFCDNLDDEWIQVPVEANSVYYIQITNQTSGAVTADINIEFQTGPNLFVPAGSILISDDANGYPAVALSGEDGSFLRYFRYPAGECADWLPTGEYCVQNGDQDDSVKILSALLNNTIATWDLPDGYLIQGIRSDHTSLFYVCYGPTGGGGGDSKVTALSADGTEGTTWTIPSSTVMRQYAINRDGTKLYWTALTNGTVKVYDLENSMALPNLNTDFSGNSVPGGISDGYVAEDGSLFFKFHISAADYIKRFDPDTGAVIQSYPILNGEVQALNHWAVGNEDDGLVVWDARDNSAFERIDITTGSITPIAENVSTRGNSGNLSATAFGISNSCPLLILITDIPVTPVEPIDIECSADIDVIIPTGGSVVVTWSDPEVTGGTPPYTIECDPPSGSSFSPGVTPVVCTVTDSNSATATCGFDVTVTNVLPNGCVATLPTF